MDDILKSLPVEETAPEKPKESQNSIVSKLPFNIYES